MHCNSTASSPGPSSRWSSLANGRSSSRSPRTWAAGCACSRSNCCPGTTGRRVLPRPPRPWRSASASLSPWPCKYNRFMRFHRLLGFVFGLLAATASAQDWPQKPVRLIVPFPPGGATDISARLVGEKLSQIWGQQVVIENRGGAGGSVGAAEAARAAPDGYTLFWPSGSVVTANQHIYEKLNYDPEKDFIPVSAVVSGPQVLT